MIRPPPRSTLFPYTTLSRSLRTEREGRGDLASAADPARREHRRGCDRVDDLGDENHRRDLTDRKSTRLNSSHGYISYAVFCLKKKKKYETSYTSCELLTYTS